MLAFLPGMGRSEPPPTRPTTAPIAVPTTAPTTAPATQPAMVVETYFTPKDDIVALVVGLIDGTQDTLDMAAYTFSHRDVSAAIVRAHQRGVRIRFVMDYTQSRNITCRAIDLIEAGIEVRTRRRRGFQHNKYLIIDDSVVLTGSFNFAPSAQAFNTENVLVIRHAPQIVAAFIQNHDRVLKDTLLKQK